MTHSDSELPAEPAEPAEIDPRVTALRQRLNEALFEVNHGEYFRARVHGWIAYLQDVDVELPPRASPTGSAPPSTSPATKTPKTGRQSTRS